ncbi:MAG TPA: DoxX subfamily [Acidobacteriota bacterium]|jgi:thiosulfate dehydrogenase [quinone] large subunit
MDKSSRHPLSSLQQTALILLRTLIGWHFLYEGYYKIVQPAWSLSGQPLPRWSSVGYLRAASGPLGGLLRKMAESGWTPIMDRVVETALLVIGLSLILGFFTQLGCYGALALLALFYILSVPVQGTPQPGTEGTYLLVNKNLVELAAVLVLLAFRTGEIAGLDLLRRGSNRAASPAV